MNVIYKETKKKIKADFVQETMQVRQKQQFLKH